MADTRIERLADVLVDYSPELRAGDRLRLHAETAAEPLLREVYRRAVRRGADVLLDLTLPGLKEVFYAEARRGQSLLDEMLALDDGARRVGEFAVGNNYSLQSFTDNILFDEKIGGTCHLALGNGIPEAGGINRSVLHWDMVCDLRQGGAIYADGQVVHENGQWRI